MKGKRRYSAVTVTGTMAVMTVLVLLSLSGRAQEVFTCRARISTTKSTNFYRIQVPAELVALCRPDLADLRIWRSDGEFIPYTRNGNLTPHADTIASPLIFPSIERKDSSDKHSYLTLFYEDTFRLEHLSLEIRDPVLYKRTVRVYDAGRTNRYAHASPLVVTSIDPQHRELEIPPTRTNRLLIDIDNADNAPLAVSRVNTVLSTVWLLAYLQADSAYDILGGDQRADFPQYDLHYFADSLSRIITPIFVGPARQQNIVILAPVTNAEKTTAPANAHHPGAVLWSIIILSLLLLTYLSVKMIKAIPENDGKDRL
ncbi:MAG TPA: hypothetical protein VNU72_11965 [Puia sp.]|nr:hypothetical protein [Puia sp.]